MQICNEVCCSESLSSSRPSTKSFSPIMLQNLFIFKLSLLSSMEFVCLIKGERGNKNWYLENGCSHNCSVLASFISFFELFIPSTPFPFAPNLLLTSFKCMLYSSTAKIRSEVLSPFRSVRMFFYLAFIASGGLGGLIATSRLIGALANPSRASEVPEIAQGLAIDIGAVSVFALLYFRENKAKNAQIAKLSREESFSNLKLCLDEKQVLPVSAFRGIARLVILSGPANFILEAFKLSEPYTEGLLERGVLVVAFVSSSTCLWS